MQWALDTFRFAATGMSDTLVWRRKGFGSVFPETHNIIIASKVIHSRETKNIIENILKVNMEKVYDRFR